MRNSAFKLIGFLAFGMPILSTPSYAASGELSQNASAGSVTFTVVIPPLGASIRAANSGAVGLWTVSNANDGLMLRVDDDSAAPTLSVFHRESAAISVSFSNPKGYAKLMRSGNDGGLELEHYGFGGLEAGVNVFTIAGI